ncbi:hypothetical protein FCG67_12230 [Rhodococcus oryzae]|uniref:Uncharacterized protein n=2 Tax=Rhodococcus oryzae TaxID=2571143 RepID=A0ABY2RK93_9NOCA|nr:hypothetical protein FCG67_12230 [Rhodococcus oryzae]
MGSRLHETNGRQPFEPATRTSRILLRARGAPSGLVDGAWWPRTTNLTLELHDVISAVATHLGRTVRVSFAWNPRSVTQRGLDRHDGVLVCGPVDGQPQNVMYLFGADGSRLALLVVPPDTEADCAYAAMRLAVGASEV